MNILRIFVLAAITMIVTISCAPIIEQSADRLTPMSYHKYTGSVPKSVGLLRRLVMPPASYIYIHDGVRYPQKEENYASIFKLNVLNFLVEKKGYEIQELDQWKQSNRETFIKWLNESKLNSNPPDNIKKIVNALGHICSCDGILILSSYHKPSSTWNQALTIISASLTWPLLFIEDKWYFDAFIIEANSGKMVWHSHVSESIVPDDGLVPNYLSSIVISLFENIEAAVPEALIE